jgi:hypothetical protein
MTEAGRPALPPEDASNADRQHPVGTLAEQLIQVGGQPDTCLLVNNYTRHRGVPVLAVVRPAASIRYLTAGRYAARPSRMDPSFG